MNDKSSAPTATETEKRAAAVKAAQRTARWARIMTKVLISKSSNKSPQRQPQWEIVNFLGPKKGESRGIIDLLAIRKSHADPGEGLKRGDLLDLVIIQVKGGSARYPTENDRKRLLGVKAHYRSREVILSEWQEGSKARFYRLADEDWQLLEKPEEIFSPKSRKLTLAKPNKR